MEKRNRRIALYAITFLIPIISLLICMIIKGCYPFGENTILVGDAGSQYISFYKELYDRVVGGNLSSFSFSSGLGYDFYSNYCYYLASPFTWIALLFGKAHMELGMIFILMLQIGGCGLTALYYFRHSKINKLEHGMVNDLFTVLFALAYALSDFMLAYQFCINWLPALMLAPLVMLGVERLVDRNDPRLYCVCLFLAFITNFYFAWYICILALIWFLDQDKKTVKKGLRAFGSFALHSVLMAMCAAFVLIPCYIAVLSKSDNWLSLSDTGLGAIGYVGTFLQGFFWGHQIDNMGKTLFSNSLYLGVSIAILSIMSLILLNNKHGKKLKRIGEILVLLICLDWIGGNFVLHGFTIPHGYSNRFAFILVLILLVTAFEGLELLHKIKGKHILLLGLLVSILFAVVLINNSEVEDFLCYFISAIIAVYILICIVLYNRASIGLGSLYINIIVVGFLEILSNPYFANVDAVDVFEERIIDSAFWGDEYDELELDAGQRKTAFVGSTMCFTYSDTDLFSSSLSTDLLFLYKSLGLYYEDTGVKYGFWGSTPLTAELFNIRYVLTDSKQLFGGFSEYEAKESYEILAADYNAGLGFMLPYSILDWETDSTASACQVQNQFTENVLDCQELFTEVQFSDITYGYNACIINDIDGSDIYYTNMESDDESNYIVMNMTVPYDMDLYIETQDDYSTYCIIYDGDDSISSGDKYIHNLIHVGEVKAGESLAIYLSSYYSAYGTSGCVNVKFYDCHAEVMSRVSAELNDSVLEIDDFKETDIKAHIEVKNSGILYTSIPYFKGFKVYVDGKECEKIKVMDAMLGIELDTGYHEIEIKYVPYGLRTGILISLFGLITELILLLVRRKKER